MRYTNLLPLAAALATAVVIPDDVTAQGLALEVEEQAGKAEKTTAEWWDTLRSTAQEQATQIKKPVVDEIVANWVESFHDENAKLEETLRRVKEKAEEALDDDFPIIFGTKDPGDGRCPSDANFCFRHHLPSNLTVYQTIQASNHTKRFAELVNDFPAIVELLNSTEANVTVFAPVDAAFGRVSKDRKPPKEWIEKLLQYHILPGFYPAGRVLSSHTLPTALKDPALAGRPQRLRVGVSIFGLELNFRTHAVLLDHFTTNGVAHAVNSILIPPPSVRQVISLFPAKFSTLELAARKTGLIPHHRSRHPQGHNLTGLTVFAPTNLAFSRLGPAANAFLFNTEKGLGYLRALLKYHIVANETLYSDAYYGIKGGVEDLIPLSSAEEFQGRSWGSERNGHFHIDLPTLLEGKNLSIDIARWLRFINVRVNGFQNVYIEDAVALDGVLQVVNFVLIPPHEHKRAWTEEDGEISVEDLVERLRPYVEGEKKETETEKTPAKEDQVWGEL
ncbi:FAS1 domain-containing protein [Xylaria telfairii]|nr:FAS1 domain-containing protein [Xylaria telfairii]